MNIDQLLSLDKSEKTSNGQNYFGLYNKSGHLNSSMSSQMAIDFLNNSTTSNLFKTTSNQLGLNSNLIENLLLKNKASNSLFKGDQTRLPTPFDLNHFQANNDMKKESKSLDENSYGTYFNQLLNQSKSTGETGENKSAHLNDQQQNLVAAFAACYSNDSNNKKLAEAMIDMTKHSTGWNESNGLYGVERPESQSSLNCSVSSTDCDDELLNKRPATFSNNKNELVQNYMTGVKESKIDSEEDSGQDARPTLYARMGLIGLDGLNETIFSEYQEWAQRTYGDSAKTKTVTQKKCERILKILNGQEPNNVENSKFRFWVKSKGFRLGAFDDQLHDVTQDVLYVPCIKSSANGNSVQISNSRNKNHSFVYKKVAVVENFFQIIYSVHVEMGGKAGKHAGQKRTYRAVSEMYAFLPREAVTRFLMSCKDCQKRMHLQINTFSKTNSPSRRPTSNKASNIKELFDKHLGDQNTLNGLVNNLKINANNTNELSESIVKSNQSTKEFDLMPLTTAYLKQMNQLNKSGSMIIDSDLNSLMCNKYLINGLSPDDKERLSNDQESNSMPSLDDSLEENSPDSSELFEQQNLVSQTKTTSSDQNSIFYQNEMTSHSNDEQTFSNKRQLDCEEFSNDADSKKIKREHFSDGKIDRVGEESLLGIGEESNQMSKEDVFEFKDYKEHSEQQEEDDEEEDDSRADGTVDSDRLKAFNMFVRLFVDDNLDRSIPISRQPKEKIQAILDSCKRQFPELQSRARKRIRTYLKSCRRTKKIQNLRKLGQCSDYELKSILSEQVYSPTDNFHLNLSKETLNQPVYHLNSAVAEKILSEAFENELLNARRIKDGLSPLSLADQLNEAQNGKMYNKNPYQAFNSNLISRLIGHKDPRQSIEESDKTMSRLNRLTNNSLENLKIASNKEKSLVNLLNGTAEQADGLSNGSKLKELLSIEQLIASSTSSSINRPEIDQLDKSNCELVAKIKSNERFLANLYNLSASELVAIKQLITGYRESAAFLLRSAKELEFLLFHQQN